MSGGAIVVAPAALGVVLLAAPVAALAGAGLAAALVLRAAQAGTEATGRALERFADEMERRAEAQEDRERQARLWGLAAAAVVEANQELRLLGVRAEQAGVRVGLPDPYDLTGRGLAETRSWLAQARQVVASARERVEEAEAERDLRVLGAALPAPPDGMLTAADLLADFAKTLASRHRGAPADGAAAGGMAASAPAVQVDQRLVRAEIDEILTRLDLDATAVEREAVLRLAARAARQRDPGTSRTYLDALARKVDQEVNQSAAGRREAAGWLVGLEHPMVAEAITETEPPLPPQLAVLERLREIVRGEADLTGQDRRDAQDAIAWAQKQVERRRLLETMAEILAAEGYLVTTTTDTGHLSKLCVTREAWRGGHSADVWIEAAGQLRCRLVELVPGAGAAASRCEDINRSLRDAGEELTARGLEAEVRVPPELLEPLQRHDPRPSGVERFEDVALKSRARPRPEEETT